MGNPGGIVEKDNLNDAAGVGPLMTLTVDGIEYKVSRIKLGHLAEVQQYALDAYRKEAMATLAAAKEILAPEEMTTLVREVMADQGNWMSMLMSPTGLQYLVYLLVHHNHEDVDEAAARKLFPIELLDTLVDRLREVLGITTGSPSEGSDSPPEEVQDIVPKV
jgi:hypothetical protein